MSEQHLFLDTEFTHFPGTGRADPQLLAIGLVSEPGATYYAAVTGWRPALCSAFVRQQVLPSIAPGDWCTRSQASARLARWLAPLVAQCTSLRVWHDHPTDWDLLVELLQLTSAIPMNLFPQLLHHGLSVEELQIIAHGQQDYWRTQGPRHQALQDAQALGHAWRILRAPHGWD